MNSRFRRQTAQILQFPPAGSRGPIGRQAQANAKQKSSIFEVETSFSTGAWYHEAAIAAPELPRKA